MRQPPPPLVVFALALTGCEVKQDDPADTGSTTAAQGACDCVSDFCSADGFEKQLVSFAIDGMAGTSEWIYQVCNQARGLRICSSGVCAGGGRDGLGCAGDTDCPGGSCTTESSGSEGDACAMDSDCDGGFCVACAPLRDLSHVDVVLPGIGDCVSDTQDITIEQAGSEGGDGVTLDCSSSDRDPACPEELCAPGTGGRFCQGGPSDGAACSNNRDCGCAPGPGCATPCESVPCEPVTSPAPLQVLKCDVAAGTNLDPGECLTMRITIAGEQPTLGSGAIDEVTKAANDCVTDNAICGPACDCEQAEDACLTRTGGFWGTHPHVTDDFLPITVCGVALEVTDAGLCSSASEALCVAPGLEACDGNTAYAQLARQLTAAKLNLAASAANGGDCGQGIADRIADCEGLCGSDSDAINDSACIDDLDEFNNSQDTLAPTPAPFDRPGPASPGDCTDANGNGILVGKSCALDCAP